VGCENENCALTRVLPLHARTARYLSPPPGWGGDAGLAYRVGKRHATRTSIVGNLTPSEYYDREDAEECIEHADSICSAARQALSG
jgi:hypothetical protein